MSAPSSEIRQLVEPLVSAAGLWLEDVELVRESGRHVLRVVVDAPEDADDSVDLDAVAAVTRSVADTLDGVDHRLPERYTLEVSTRGATAPLTARRHYTRAIGRLVVLELAEGDPLRGRLVGVEPEGDAEATLVVTPETPGVKGRPPKVGEPVRTPLSAVRAGVVEVELRGGKDEED
ncbi:ribosome maturation factor RimP [Cellulomonas sp. RIT-PI-Y]|jgi:ribosome maturation factor RimP|uniref:ribosome maturation factor RimP n=1 Tax=Cellulomonas sp. RIT-PI-Y TaxID=3035297 RepID=UPI0021D919E4|nr:ribosome maturation factor RimP [Cellulomonas sp. RIT-PI-Y]